jgi:hypothetical protein
MRRLPRTILSLMLLLFLLASLGARGFHSKELLHDLEHHGQNSNAILDCAHEATAPDNGEKAQSEPFDEAEHHLFHSVSTQYLLASAIGNFSWDASAPILVPASDAPKLPAAELEPPYRPPRSLTLT